MSYLKDLNESLGGLSTEDRNTQIRALFDTTDVTDEVNLIDWAKSNYRNDNEYFALVLYDSNGEYVSIRYRYNLFSELRDALQSFLKNSSVGYQAVKDSLKASVGCEDASQVYFTTSNDEELLVLLYGKV